jgi:AraC-like DNA-binding protein
MHIPVILNDPPFCSAGYNLDIFRCAFDTVEQWGEPILRNTFWRCYLPVDGGMSLRAATTHWSLRADEGVLIPPECDVRGHAVDTFTLFYAHFDCTLALTESTPLLFTVPASIREALHTAASTGNKTALRMATLQLVVTGLASIPADTIAEAVVDRRMERAYGIMKEHIDTRLTNTELARQLNLSEASLLRLFRDTVGVSPQKELLRLRLNHAATLLQQTTRSIERIASECGFWDRNHFTRVFTREWKTPPATYRKSATAL